MMTFLEFCCLKLLGEPTHFEGECPCWLCPRCEHPRFHTRPHREEYKDRFSCWRCGSWGDELDLMRELHPAWGRDTCRLKLKEMRHEYEGLATKRIEDPSPILLRGTGRHHVCMTCKIKDKYHLHSDEFTPDADRAIEELLAHMGTPDSPALRAEEMQLIKHALQLCAEHRLHPLGLAGRMGFVLWSREIDAEHMAECEDPECDWLCCRLDRGWTKEEIEEDKRERRERIRENSKR